MFLYVIHLFLPLSSYYAYRTLNHVWHRPSVLTSSLRFCQCGSHAPSLSGPEWLHSTLQDPLQAVSVLCNVIRSPSVAFHGTRCMLCPLEVLELHSTVCAHHHNVFNSIKIPYLWWWTDQIKSEQWLSEWVHREIPERCYKNLRCYSFNKKSLGRVGLSNLSKI